jgi:hypothetical protein
MAERRMFAKTIILSDAFLDMPATSRCLYMTLCMVADDDGFVNNPRSIMRQSGASDDDMRILIGKKFVIIFDDGVVVIKHWRIHNYLRSDRYHETKYLEHKASLSIDEKEGYTQNGIPSGTPLVDQMDTEVRLGKDSIGKDRLGKDKEKRFAPPSVEEVDAYIKEQGYTFDADAFVDFYASKGWKVGSQPMKDWKAACRTWQRRRDEDRKKDAERNQKSGKVDADFWAALEAKYEAEEAEANAKTTGNANN